MVSADSNESPWKFGNDPSVDRERRRLAMLTQTTKVLGEYMEHNKISAIGVFDRTDWVAVIEMKECGKKKKDAFFAFIRSFIEQINVQMEKGGDGSITAKMEPTILGHRIVLKLAEN
jgi:hypothetical protein